MILYRAMCKGEYDNISGEFPLSWSSKCKWFSENLSFTQDRVLDKKFNNSKFKPDRYKYLVKYEVDDKFNKLVKVSNNELMLRVRDQPLIKFVNVQKLGEITKLNNLIY